MRTSNYVIQKHAGNETIKKWVVLHLHIMKAMLYYNYLRIKYYKQALCISTLYFKKSYPLLVFLIRFSITKLNFILKYVRVFTKQ